LTAARHIDGECSANRIKQKTDHPKTPDPPTQFVEEPQVDDEKKLRVFMFSEKGLRRLENYQRYFLVKFRNGTVKMVQPNARRAQFTISEKMAAWIKRRKESE